MLYLEARCVCLQRAMGVQGTQNGGIDGAPEPPNCVSESNSLSFQLTSGADQTTIGEVIDNKKYGSGKY